MEGAVGSLSEMILWRLDSTTRRHPVPWYNLQHSNTSEEAGTTQYITNQKTHTPLDTYPDDGETLEEPGKEPP